MSRHLLGFDVLRLSAAHFARVWTAEHRDEYLLHPQTPYPLSLDRINWPTAFDAAPDWDAATLAKDDVAMARWFWEATDLWSDVAAMRSVLAASVDDTVVALQILTPLKKGRRNHRNAAMFEGADLRPASLDDAWKTLGFDIADAGRTSGLSNCGYEPAEREAMAAQWGAALNEFGLVRDEATALALCDVTNKRVPEHAPFFVYEIAYHVASAGRPLSNAQ